MCVVGQPWASAVLQPGVASTPRRLCIHCIAAHAQTNSQTRRLTKFPDYMREKCECFQERPPRHAVAREQTRQKLPDLQLPAEVGGGAGFDRRRWQPGQPIGHSSNVRASGVATAQLDSAAITQPAAPGPRPSPLPFPLSQIVGPIQVARRSDMDMNGHVNNVSRCCAAALCRSHSAAAALLGISRFCAEPGLDHRLYGQLCCRCRDAPVCQVAAMPSTTVRISPRCCPLQLLASRSHIWPGPWRQCHATSTTIATCTRWERSAVRVVKPG